MRYVILGLIFTTVFTASAGVLTSNEQSQVINFKSSLDEIQENLKMEILNTGKRLERYQQLSELQFIKKRDMKRENCNILNFQLGRNLNNFIDLMEETKESLKKLDLSPENSLSIKRSLKLFTANSRIAIEGCEDIQKSLEAIKAAEDGIREAGTVLTYIF